MKTILIWEINNYYEMGGGTYYYFFDNNENLLKKVNELNKTENLGYFKCYEIGDEIEFEEVTKITEFKIK